MGDNPFHDRLLKQHNINGVPTLVFLDAQGRARRDLRIVDFMLADRFLNHIAGLLQSETGQ